MDAPDSLCLGGKLPARQLGILDAIATILLNGYKLLIA